MTKKELTRIKTEVDLRDFARGRYGIESNEAGLAHCPFHLPDKNPSFQFWKGRDGIYRYTDHHEPKKIGTIVDFVMAMDRLSERGAFIRLEGLFSCERQVRDEPNTTVYFYVYKGLDGSPVFRKGKQVDACGEKFYWLERFEDGHWIKGKGNRESIPYNLHERPGKRTAIVCEGEKDAESVKEVVKAGGLEYWVTSAMYGKAAWPPSITPYFEGLTEVLFIYDVGAEMSAVRHSSVLQAAFKDLRIRIGRVPLEERDADITNLFEQVERGEDDSSRLKALMEVIANAEEYVGVTADKQASPVSGMGEEHVSA